MTNFENLIKNLKVEDFARMIVKIAIINNSEPYYVTSSGQLYPMNPEGYNAAVEHETNFWNSNFIEDKKETK